MTTTSKERWHLSKSINPLSIAVFVLTVTTTYAGAFAYYQKDQEAQNARIGDVEAGVVRLSGEVRHVREIQQVQVNRQDEIRGLVQDQLARVESKLDSIESYLREVSK